MQATPTSPSSPTLPPPRRREDSPGTSPIPEPDGNGHLDGNSIGSTDHSAEEWGQVTKPGRGPMMVAALVVTLLVVALFLTGLIPRVENNATLNAEAQAQRDAGVPVNVAKPIPSKADVDITVPGTLRPDQEVSIFARTTGYLGKWWVDISNRVKAGQVMAKIDAPDTDQQLSQAQATLAQLKAAVEKAQSDLLIAQQTYDRFYSLRGTNGVTQQELDQYFANQAAAKAALDAAKANEQAGEANVKRLADLQSFETIVAPFDGVVTGRAYDTGAMIIADPTDTTMQPIYKIAKNDVLRVFVNVPQSSALNITQFMPAKVTASELPGKVFDGQVLGTTNYLDPMSRSLLTEVKVPNQSGALLPGMFVNVTFQQHRDKVPLLIPGPALIQNADGNQVAIVQNGKAHFVHVQLGVDYGNTIEVTDGLTGDEEVIANPGERVIEGAKVSTKK